MLIGGRATAFLVSCLMLSVMFASLCPVSVNAADAAVELENPVVVVKDGGSPRSSAVTRSFTSDYYGEWVHWVENSGLKSLTIDIYDTTAGTAAEVAHIRVRFAEYDAFPSGRVDLPGVVVGKGRTYEIMLTPYGPRGAEASYYHGVPNGPPVADFVCDVDGLHVDVDGSASYDWDGWIVSHFWNWGDGSPDYSSGSPTARHTYSTDGIYAITLTVTDNEGLSAKKTELATIRAPEDTPPVASFNFIVDGFTVQVDASSSTDDHGITRYVWSWGDGWSGFGVTSSHPYFQDSLVNPTPAPPYNVMGYIYDPNGNAVPGCLWKVQNMMTGDFVYSRADVIYGFYAGDLLWLPHWVNTGDVINVTAIDGSLIGYRESTADLTSYFLWMDVNLAYRPMPTMDAIITLWVYDELGQSSHVSQRITFNP